MKNKITFLTLILSTNIFANGPTKKEMDVAIILSQLRNPEIKRARKKTLPPEAIQQLFDEYVKKHKAENLDHNQNRCLCLCKYCENPNVTLWTNIKQHLLRMHGKKGHARIKRQIQKKELVEKHTLAHTNKKINFQAIIN